MIHWFINSLYECCFGKKKRVKFMVVDKVAVPGGSAFPLCRHASLRSEDWGEPGREELSQHEIEQLRKC